jgi:hypothetical protein
MMRSYTINQQAWLTLFIDADRSLKVFGFTPIAFESKIGENSAYTVPKLASQYITASSSATPGWGGVNQVKILFTFFEAPKTLQNGCKGSPVNP